MSIGTGPGNPIEHKKEIPFSWFVGGGPRNAGIGFVGFSKKFYKLAPELESLINLHESRIDNTRVGNDIVIDNNRTPYQGKFKEEIENAERRIKEITDFSIQELHAKLDDLRKSYMGKTEAPFEIKFY